MKCVYYIFFDEGKREWSFICELFCSFFFSTLNNILFYKLIKLIIFVGKQWEGQIILRSAGPVENWRDL